MGCAYVITQRKESLMKSIHGSGRGSVMDKCFKTIEVLMAKRLTPTELANEVGYSHKTAHRYIESASLYFPVNSEPRKIQSGHTVEAFKIEFKKDRVK